MKPGFDVALQQHFAAIASSDIKTYKFLLSRGDTLSG
jgi:hypothetical protein